ncbi:MAG: peptide-methionine (S)-S-oxide reductase MsrA [Chitinophagaceae bacterium]|nr:peptide-methionine (S)-S-oxide reductase MsrA [Chitinophagaceae bacterium]
MKLIFAVVVVASLVGCTSSKDNKPEQVDGQKQSNENKIPVGDPIKPSTIEAVAYFSEGCFWHTEIVFQSLDGVRDAISGYAGGTTADPDYEKISGGNTGHAETVQVFYDPAKISFETLVKAFFASHDPTQLNRQGNDVGTQYRSIAFYSNDEEKQIIEKEIKAVAGSKIYPGKIVTEIKLFSHFYPAEDYHQEYIIHHPENRYVQNISIPDYLKFRKEFKGKFK